jgi:restriction system protein
MPIPDFQTIMLPLLQSVKDGQEYSTTTICEILAAHFQLTETELSQLLPSGTQKTFYNRVFWAKAHLKMAGLIENIKRGYFKITTPGSKALESNPIAINLKFLRQYQEYLENIGRNKDSTVPGDDQKKELVTTEATPEEQLAFSYLEIRKSLASELLSKIKSCSPTFFENVVVELLVKMGYGGSVAEAGATIGKSGDEGIDGIIKEDRLGLDIIYIQAKRWEGTVGRPEIQKFLGAVVGQGANKGVFITTSRFSKEALDYNPRNDCKIVLIDGHLLTQLMIDYNLGVSVHQSYEIKRMDNDYFDEV